MPKPPPKLNYQNDLLKNTSDVTIHEKLDIIIENQKVFFKFMADVMRGGFVGTYTSNEFNQDLRHAPNMEGESIVSEERNRESSVSVGRGEGGLRYLVFQKVRMGKGRMHVKTLVRT